MRRPFKLPALLKPVKHAGQATPQPECSAEVQEGGTPRAPTVQPPAAPPQAAKPRPPGLRAKKRPAPAEESAARESAELNAGSGEDVAAAATDGAAPPATAPTSGEEQAAALVVRLAVACIPEAQPVQASHADAAPPAAPVAAPAGWRVQRLPAVLPESLPEQPAPPGLPPASQLLGERPAGTDVGGGLARRLTAAPQRRIKPIKSEPPANPCKTLPSSPSCHTSRAGQLPRLPTTLDPPLPLHHPVLGDLAEAVQRVEAAALPRAVESADPAVLAASCQQLLAALLGAHAVPRGRPLCPPPQKVRIVITPAAPVPAAAAAPARPASRAPAPLPAAVAGGTAAAARPAPAAQHLTFAVPPQQLDEARVRRELGEAHALPLSYLRRLVFA